LTKRVREIRRVKGPDRRRKLLSNGGEDVSNSDSFIDEVAEEVRRDKLFALFRRYGWIGLVAILALVGTTAWVEYSGARDQQRAAAFGDAMLQALDTGDAGARDASLAGIPAAGGQEVIRALAQATDPVSGRDQALAALDSVISKSELDPVYRDLAMLRRVMILGVDMAGADRDAALADLAIAGRPYAPLARELQALALIDAGQLDAAIAAFNALAADSSTPDGLRQRAFAMVMALGGAPEVVEPTSDALGG
jgi:hypothetical protein